MKLSEYLSESLFDPDPSEVIDAGTSIDTSNLTSIQIEYLMDNRAPGFYINLDKNTIRKI